MPDKVEILTTKIPVAYLGYANVGACTWPTWQKISKLHMCDIAIIHISVLCDQKMSMLHFVYMYLFMW